MISITYKFQLNSIRYNDHYNSYASKKVASYEYWTANNQKVFTLRLSFLQLSKIELHIDDDSNPNFQSVNKKLVHHEKLNFSGKIFQPTSKKFIFQQRNLNSPFLFHFFYNLKTAYTMLPRRIYDPLKKKLPIYPQTFSRWTSHSPAG